MLWPSPPWDEVVYWALDLETGGLDPRTDAILAVGMIPVRAGGVRLGETFASLVRPEGADHIDPGSIRAHQLVPGDVSGAPGLAEVIERIHARITEGALLVHQAALDVAFLKRAYKRVGRRWPDPPIVDTVALLLKVAKRARLIHPDAPDQEPDLNLLAARRKLGLPDYGQHDALTDAIATAELFLALRRRLGAKTLRDVA
ncbi:3'-5' exonuclease [Anaeromyxobacter oryzae]|uniref:3'-5' exonuclease n=1 Tax=Anaeromyxobacter oryzae TaxID=2918170 RepID=A0ABN6MX61_9BACT|nr:3'-5' exonuclease [Anaeromyxobacter oryzae]